MPLNDIFRQRTQALVASLTSYRILLYALVSTLAVSAAIANALKNQSNFYSVAIYLSKSNRSVVVSGIRHPFSQISYIFTPGPSELRIPCGTSLRAYCATNILWPFESS